MQFQCLLHKSCMVCTTSNNITFILHITSQVDFMACREQSFLLETVLITLCL